jgi:hypothetical protein
MAFGVCATGQVTPNAVLVDSVRKPYCEDLLVRLDKLAAEATETSGFGIVMIYQGSNVFDNVAYERAIRNYSVFRNFPDGLIRVLRMESKSDEPILEFWRTTNRSEAQGQNVPLSYVVNVPSRKRVVDESLEVIRYNGKLDYALDRCSSAFSLDVLAKVFSSNPDVSAEIVIFNKTTRGAQRLSSLIRKSARSEHDIRDNRLKIVLGGSGPAKEWAANVSAVEIWLVPSNRK